MKDGRNATERGFAGFWWDQFRWSGHSIPRDSSEEEYSRDYTRRSSTALLSAHTSPAHARVDACDIESSPFPLPHYISPLCMSSSSSWFPVAQARTRQPRRCAAQRFPFITADCGQITLSPIPTVADFIWATFLILLPCSIQFECVLFDLRKSVLYRYPVHSLPKMLPRIGVWISNLKSESSYNHSTYRPC